MLLRTLLGGLGRPTDPDEESWGDVGSKLSRAVLALAQAEASGLQKELQGSLITLRRLLVGLAIGLGLSLFAAVFVFAAVFIGLSQLMHPALAALLLAALLGGVAVFWLVRARQAVARLETPAHTVRRRVNSHLDWWRDEVKTVARPDSPSSTPGNETGTVRSPKTDERSRG